MQRIERTPGEQKIRNLISIFVFGSFFIYMLVRAFHLSFTHDECLSFSIVKGDAEVGATANNHLLNTYLMAFCSNLFGDDEIFLRLPNVLAFIIYTISSYKILKQQKGTLFYLFGISLLFFNLYVLDFFSLARGYGLSLGFMMGALYFLLRTDNRSGSRTYLGNFIKAMLCSSLALFSNLALINFHIALLFLFLIEYIGISRREKNNFKKHIRFILIYLLALVPLLLAVKRFLFLKISGQLYFGEESFDSSVSSLLQKCLFAAPYPLWFIITIDKFIRYAFPIGLIITILMKNFSGPLAKISALMAIVIIGLFLENILFSTSYPPGRTAVYFVPLFGLFLYFFFRQFLQNRGLTGQRIISVILLIIFSFPPAAHLIKEMNITNTIEWRYDSHTKDAMIVMEKDLGRSPAKSPKTTLEAEWVFEPAIKYYIALHKLNVVTFIRDSILVNSDYIYDYESHFHEPGYVELVGYPEFETRLYKKKQ